MVQLAHDGTNIEKINDILEAAQKRFGSYGFEKTTMNEIASDLGISKAALYYYFPDKESLYKAVVDKESDIVLSHFSKILESSEDPREVLLKYTEIRLNYFRNLMNLTRIRIEENKGVKNIMMELRIRLREKEKAQISRILTKGKELNIFDFEDIETVADLFLDTIRGITLIYKKNHDITYFNEEEFKIHRGHIILFVNIFIKGISK